MNTAMLVLAALAVISLVGCAIMIPDAADIARDNKNAAVVCSTFVGTGGTYKIVIVNQEAGVIADGGISVNSDCLVQTQSVQPPPPPPRQLLPRLILTPKEPPPKEPPKEPAK